MKSPKQPSFDIDHSSHSLGRRLRTARINAGYTKARALAAALGVTANTYYRYERDETTPSFRTLAKIAVILDAPLSELLADGHSNSEKSSYDLPTREPSNTAGLTESVSQANGEHFPLDQMAECSLLAWRLAAELCDRETNGSRKDEDTWLKEVTALYLELKISPASVLAKHQPAIKANPSILTAAGRYLSMYHDSIERQLKSGRR